VARSRRARPSDIGELALGLPETAEAVAWGDRPAYQAYERFFVILLFLGNGRLSVIV
jgi:hypothetical protein